MRQAKCFECKGVSPVLYMASSTTFRGVCVDCLLDLPNWEPRQIDFDNYVYSDESPRQAKREYEQYHSLEEYVRESTCDHCDHPLMYGQVPRSKKFCSGACASAFYRPVVEERPCEQCERLFTPKRKDAKYCSGSCKTKAFRNRSAV